MIANLCAPAFIYLAYGLIQIIIDTFNGLYNTAIIKSITTIIFTLILNGLCSRGLGVVSWLIVFIPFIMMTIIVAIMLMVFGLDPSTGKRLYGNNNRGGSEYVRGNNGVVKVNVSNMNNNAPPPPAAEPSEDNDVVLERYYSEISTRKKRAAMEEAEKEVWDIDKAAAEEAADALYYDEDDAEWDPSRDEGQAREEQRGQDSVWQ